MTPACKRTSRRRQRRTCPWGLPPADAWCRLFATLIQPHILRPAVFVFLLNATPSSGSAWFFFYTDILHFNSTFIGTISTVGSVATLIGTPLLVVGPLRTLTPSPGVFLFQGFFSKQSFRKVLFMTTVASSFLGLSQLILVFRWNLLVGIPDGFFCLGESAINSVVGWINTMPILVLASRLCPPGLEGTLYALIMSINNLGSIVGTQIGALITYLLGEAKGGGGRS